MLQQALEKVAGQTSLVRERYDNYIGGAWVAPASGELRPARPRPTANPATRPTRMRTTRGIRRADAEITNRIRHISRKSHPLLTSP